jgi:hypothetical protein
VANVLFNCYIHDLATGFKAMRTELMRRLRFGGHGFDVDPQITARVLRLGYRIHEVPISYYARSRADGKKVSWRDGVIALVTLVRIRLTPGRMLFGQDQYHAARVVPIAAAPQLTPLPGEGALDQADTVVASETRR